MRFDRLKNYMDTLSSVGVPGCDLLVMRDHQVLFRYGAGCSDAEGKVPVRGDEMYWLFSCTKVITTCAAMQLIEQGKLHPDDPVGRYLPSYRKLTVRDENGVRPAQNVMTVRHLMSMQSGLDYELNRPAVRRAIRETGGAAGTLRLAQAMAEDPLCFEPGTDFLYSLSHDVLAAVIEVITGETFMGYLRKHIFDPLGLRDFSFVLTPENEKRLAAIYLMKDGELTLRPKDSNNYQLTPSYESGGAGLMGCVKEYAAFLDAVACGGLAENGARILAPEMIQLWNANQLTPASRRTFDTWGRRGYSYGLGVRTRVDLSAGGPGSVGEFGWDGAAGAWAMIDPTLHLSAFYAMHVRGFGYSYDVIHPTLRGLIYEGLTEP